ncbi:DUF305 domain-containing protein [Saccharospirillum salsuginis]|uniref:DUF305 domain-containing protein n=1 Tax=Saccharospirillum salsuginis TaxID=418750 RepID=A0A918K534_9GAMM|nr:DUF305 domain-containing protein [Saccharospirillum salsuginis]GGX45263.1 hypothetical protein GCM10007392_10250 [Saccharospirillum salsuginis]
MTLRHWMPFVLGALLMLVGSLSAETGDDAGPLFNARQAMFNALYDYELTGDPNYDYAQLLVPLNLEAVDMAETLKDESDDDRLLRVANMLKDDVDTEIEALQAWQERFSAPTPGDDADAVTVAFEGVRERMMERRDELQSNDDLEGSAAATLTWYHEAAIALTHVTLEHSVDAQLRLLASDIKRDHTRQIAELRNWRTLR